jgi:hypothetical protein
VLERPGGGDPVEDLGVTRTQLVPRQGAEDRRVAGGEPVEDPVVEVLVDDKVAQPA